MTGLLKDNKSNRIKSLLVFLVFVTLFLWSRTIFLDRDLPPGLVSYYVPIDEFYYTIPAFNLYHYGETNHTVVPYIIDKNVPVNIAENTVTHWSLDLFGNNYYGLRMASVFAALIVFAMVYQVLKTILCGYTDSYSREAEAPNSANSKYLFYFLITYMICDFSFLIAGRVAEPTIFRMAALALVLYLGSLKAFSEPLQSKLYSFLWGFLALGAVTYVYVYNAFIFFAMSVSTFFWAYHAGARNAIKQSAFFVLGSTVCLLSYNFYLATAYGSNILEVYQAYVPFKHNMGLGMTSISLIEKLGSHLLNAALPFMTNIFRFNIICLFFFLLALPLFIEKVKKNRSNFDILVANLLIFLILQSIVINDWYLRKMLIILPMVLIIIALAFTYEQEYFRSRLNLKGGKTVVWIYGVLAWIFALYCFAIYANPTKAGPAANATGDLQYLNLAVFLIVTFMMVVVYFFSAKIKAVAIVTCVLLIFIPNLSLDARYVFLNRTYYFRDTMIAMKDKVNGKIIAGGCAYGFRLYNNSVPILNFYETGFSYDEQRVKLYHQNFARVFTDGKADFSVAFVEVDPMDPLFRGKSQLAASGSYMIEHDLKLDDEFTFPNIPYGDIGIYALSNDNSGEDNRNAFELGTK